MQSVGQRLRQTREAQGRSLEDVNLSTRIPVRSLEAIEQDDVTRISSAFLYRSFVRQIAAFLGIDYAGIESAVNAAVERIPAPLIPGEGASATAPKVAALRVGRKRTNKLLYALSSFAAVLVGCSAFYAFLESPRFNLPFLGQNAPAQNVPSTRSSGFTLELSATEPAWLSIIADGKESFDGILQRDQTKTLEGRRTARVKTANAGGVEVVFNGKSLGALGPHGQTRTVLFTKNRYQVLNQSAGLTLPSQPFQILPASAEPSAQSATLVADASFDAPTQ